MQTELHHLPALSSLLFGLSMQDIRDYAWLRTILVYAPYLSPEFDGPLVGLNKALVGVDVPNAYRAVAPLVHLDAFHPDVVRSRQACAGLVNRFGNPAMRSA